MPRARIAHVGLSTSDPQAQAAFYQGLFGMQLVGGAKNGANTFVASHPEQENHDLAFFKDNPRAAHIALRVESPEDLLEFYHEARDREVPILYTWNHGFALAVYISDSDGNIVEVYWATGREDYQPPYVEQLHLEGQTATGLRELAAQMPGPNQKKVFL
jgi:catechol-2,3-dioxygenase